jgi:hypothetical protein
MINKILSLSNDLRKDLANFNKNEVCIEYIKHFRKEPPEWLRDDFCKKFPKNFSEEIPKEFSKNFSEEFCKEVPKNFSEEFCKEVPKKQETPAMYWIMVMKRDIPVWMRHDIKIRSLYGNTLAMLWIEHVATNPPKWMRHSPYLKNKFGKTCMLLWLYYSSELIPTWMIYIPPNKFRLKNSFENMLLQSFKEYSLLKYSTDPIRQFIIMFLGKEIKAKDVYNFFERMCLEQNYEILPEEILHIQLRKRVFIRFDDFGNIIYLK